MGVRILSGEAGAVFYCSTSDWAFGPLMKDEQQANAFLEWLPQDARCYADPPELEKKWCEFLKEKCCAQCQDPLDPDIGFYKLCNENFCVCCGERKGVHKNPDTQRIKEEIDDL